MSKLRRNLAINLLALCLGLAPDNSAFAARLLSATFQVNGQTVLQSTYEDDDFWGAPPVAETVWRYLATEPLWVEKGGQVKADAADPLKAKLEGLLVIRFQHVDRLIVEAKTTELRLIRTKPSSDKWFVPKEEVERVAKANNIPPIPSRVSITSIVLSLAVLILVVGICAWLLVRTRWQGLTK